MKASLKWLNDWVELADHLTGDGPQKIADLLTARGIEVEAIHRQDQGLEKVITAQIIQKTKHPEADRLSVCIVNARSEVALADAPSGYLEIVCGAQNMKMGDIVCLAQIGADLPNGLKIEKSKIRGVVSHGMLCSESELGFAKESDGILILPPKTPIGWKLADVLELDDTVLEIKLTANRGDCLSHRGLAREIAAALGRPMKPHKKTALNWQNGKKITLDAGQLCSQFFAVGIDGVKVGPSPSWLKNRLETIGQRSINNIVDISNFLMFDLGFPVHIYDADRLEGDQIGVRVSQTGEKLKLLDGSEIVTIGEELLIVDASKPVGLAGVMGGGNSDVTDSTKRVVIECAEFDPTRVRRSAFQHQKRSEASLRFEKGIDPAGLEFASQRLADWVIKVAGGEVIGSSKAQSSSRSGFSIRAIQTTPSFLNSYLGTSIADADLARLLESIDCKVTIGTVWTIEPPSYRLDLTIPQDLAEEVARTFGYDRIPTTIPKLSGAPRTWQDNSLQHRLDVIDRWKNILADQGLSEVLNYSFTSAEWLAKFGMQSTVKVLNPLSEEQEWMVPSLLPGMMRAYQENERHHFGSEPLAVRLFEIRPVFSSNGSIEAKTEMDTGVHERLRMAFLVAGPRWDQAMKEERGEVDFFDLKAIFESGVDRLGIKGIRSRDFSEHQSKSAGAGSVGAPSSDAAIEKLFHPGQTLQISAGKEKIGFFGRIHPKMERDFKLRQPIFWGEIDLDPTIGLTPQKSANFQKWSSFPTMERDFALLVKKTINAESLVNSALKCGKPIAKVVKIFDTYRGSSIPEGQISIGVRVIFSDPEKSLEEKQVDQMAELIVKKWSEEFDAVLR